MIPRVLRDAIVATADRQNVNASTLYYLWEMQAVQLAQHGYGHLLPQDRTLRGEHGGGDNGAVTWRQSAEEDAQCRAILHAAGSSVSAVLGEAGRSYVTAGGLVVMMSWPPKSAWRIAA